MRTCENCRWQADKECHLELKVKRCHAEKRNNVDCIHNYIYGFPPVLLSDFCSHWETVENGRMGNDR